MKDKGWKKKEEQLDRRDTVDFGTFLGQNR